MDMLARVSLSVLLTGGLAAAAQHPDADEPAAAVVERIRAGGWFETPRWRRGENGALEVFVPAADGQTAGAFEPLLGAGNERGLGNAGVIGFLSLVCHGPGDLLGMTDPTLHFPALGVDPGDVGLRQFLALPPPPFDGARGRAELLDRLLAIDLLERRGCRQALAELRQLAAAEQLPAVLRDRARRAVALLQQRADPVVRRRLDAATLRLPAAFDACLLLDHARLPDLGWLTSFGRRIAALVTATALDDAPDAMLTAAMKNDVQLRCDLVGELPFGIVHHYGNARLDHSCVVVTARPGGDPPFTLTWQAAGDFEHERWQGAALSAEAAAQNPLLAASTLTITADRLFATTDGSEGRPRPTLAGRLGLADDGHGLRVVVPGNSKLWPALAFLEAPPAEGAELRVSFGDPAVVVLAVTARDEDAAAAWLALGQRWIAELQQWIDGDPPAVIADAPGLRGLLDRVLATAFSVKGDTAFAVVQLPGVTPATVQAVVLALATAR